VLIKFASKESLNLGDQLEIYAEVITVKRGNVGNFSCTAKVEGELVTSADIFMYTKKKRIAKPCLLIHRLSFMKSAKIHKNCNYCSLCDDWSKTLKLVPGNRCLILTLLLRGPNKDWQKITIFYSFASIGGDPQDITYQDGQESNLVIGDDNLIREFLHN
jgi:hypothetical protein